MLPIPSGDTAGGTINVFQSHTLQTPHGCHKRAKLAARRTLARIREKGADACVRQHTLWYPASRACVMRHADTGSTHLRRGSRPCTCRRHHRSRCAHEKRPQAHTCVAGMCDGDVSSALRMSSMLNIGAYRIDGKEREEHTVSRKNATLKDRKEWRRKREGSVMHMMHGLGIKQAAVG